MKDSYCRLDERLSILIPEIMDLIENDTFNSLDKWFKNYYPNETKLREIV